MFDRLDSILAAIEMVELDAKKVPAPPPLPPAISSLLQTTTKFNVKTTGSTILEALSSLKHTLDDKRPKTLLDVDLAAGVK